MGLELTFSIEGDAQLIRRLQDVEKDFKNWTPEFKKVGSLLMKTFQTQINSGGSELGESWQPLNPQYRASKIKHGYPPDILIKTGRMKNSFLSQPGQYDVVVSNSTSYFKYHQSNKPRQKLPRRVVMKLDERRKELIVKIFQSAVQDRLKNRGFASVSV